MDDPKALVEKRISHIIESEFDQAMQQASRASAEAHSKNPNSGAWVINATNRIEEIFAATILQCFAQIHADISTELRGDPEQFWGKVREKLTDRNKAAFSSMKVSLVSRPGRGPASQAIFSRVEQSSLKGGSLIVREATKFAQRDQLALASSRAISLSKAPALPPTVPEPGPEASNGSPDYVNLTRLAELKQLKNHDPSRLIRMCEELNEAFRREAYISTILLLRAILDHVPPLFGLGSFAMVANNHGTKSFKESMDRLEKSSRKIADLHLRTQIRKRESLPNATQVNFSQDLDVLLGEVIRFNAQSVP